MSKLFMADIVFVLFF